jgi:hypothetical protein
MTTAIEALSELFELSRWVPYRMQWNDKREKFDKVPYSGKHGLSTKNPAHWETYHTAAEMAKAPGLSGVGLVMTGSIQIDDWQLLGLDFDDVDFEDFKLPFDTYMELSPSHKGVRAFVWVPAHWAATFKDSTVPFAACHHAEIYFGTAPRFLTVTFEAIEERAIARVKTTEALSKIEKWGLNKVEEPKQLIMPEAVGTAVRLADFGLSVEQNQLCKGTGQMDRSAVLHGLLIKLIDGGAPLDDVLATIVDTPALWAYCMSHRRDAPERALQFAKEEISRAYAKSMTGMRAELVGFNSDWKDVVIPEPAHPDLEFPQELYDDAPGLVGEIARWIHAASYTPRCEFAYACALSMTAALVGPYCTHGSRNGKLNMYIVLIGETGTGKNEAFDTMGMLLNATDAKDCIQDFPASEAGLRRQLNVTPNILIRMDEMAHKLETMQGGGNGSGLSRALLEAYNGSRMPAKAYSDSAKSLPAVENPFVQIIGGATDKVWDVVKTNHLEDGTLNRFVFVSLPPDAEYSFCLEPNAKIPKELKDKLNAFFRQGRQCDLIGYTPEGYGRQIQYSDEVKQAIQELSVSAWELQRQKHGNLYTRFVHNTTKIMSILVAGDGREVATMTDYEQAQKFMRWSIANTYHKVDERMADSSFEKQTKRLLALINANGGKIRMRDAYRQLHISRRDMTEVIGTLQLAAEVVVFEEDNNDKAGKVTEWICLAPEE